MPIWAYIPAALAIVGFVLLGVHNALVKAEKEVDEAWPPVDAVLAKRRALVSQIVTTVHSFAPQEQVVLALLNESRVVADASTQGSARQAASAENNLTRALRGLFLVTPRHPALNADPTFRSQQQQLAQLEIEVAGPRAAYNDKVEAYERRRGGTLARTFVSIKGFKAGEPLESAAG